MSYYTCSLKAGHAGTTSLISHILPNIIILLDANTYFGSCKSKIGDIAEPISKILGKNICHFILEMGFTNLLEVA